MKIVIIIKAWVISLWKAMTERMKTGADVIEQARLFFLATVYSDSVKRLIRDQSGAMSIAEEFMELGIGAVMAGVFEFYGISTMINYTFPAGTNPIVSTMATVFLAIMFIIADVFIIMKYVKHNKSTGRYG